MTPAPLGPAPDFDEVDPSPDPVTRGLDPRVYPLCM